MLKLPNEYRVNLYNHAIWTGEPWQTVEAESHIEAGEKLADEKLSISGPIGRLRAKVYEVGDAPNFICFYSSN